MSDEGEWGPWIEHDGKGCPCVGMVVHTIHEMLPGRFEESVCIAGCRGGLSWDWSNWLVRLSDGTCSSRIIRYRIRKPRGLTILESLLENLPEGVDA